MQQQTQDGEANERLRTTDIMTRRTQESPSTTIAKQQTLALAILASTGCGGGLIAPEGAQSEAFLNQVRTRCGRYNIGTQPINYLHG